MAQITSGRVVFGRTVQPANFESKKAEVELSFTLAEGEELKDTLDEVGEKCKEAVLDLVLGKK